MFQQQQQEKQTSSEQRPEGSRGGKSELVKGRQRGGPQEECGAEFQEELKRHLGSPAGSRSWRPRRVLIRLQGGTREERERERRNKGSRWRRRRRPCRGAELQHSQPSTLKVWHIQCFTCRRRSTMQRSALHSQKPNLPTCWCF